MRQLQIGPAIAKCDGLPRFAQEYIFATNNLNSLCVVFKAVINTKHNVAFGKFCEQPPDESDDRNIGWLRSVRLVDFRYSAKVQLLPVRYTQLVGNTTVIFKHFVAAITRI